jgi:hypothetical protein
LAREVRTELRDLIDSGRCNWHTTMDITLTGGDQLFLSTGEIHVNRFGKDQLYLAKLTPDVGPLSMSLDIEVDQQEFKISNVDMEIGRTLTTAARKLDGAQVISGILFIDPDSPLEDAIWDAKIPGELVASAVEDESVPFSLISTIDAIVVAGRTISSEFQWQEPVSNVPEHDPDDNPRGDDDPIRPGRKGRYGDFDPIFPRTSWM